MEMNIYEVWYYIMVVSFVAAGIFLVIAVVFFFRAHIPSTIAVLNGRAQKKDIERIRTEIDQDGYERFHYFEGEEKRAEARREAKGSGKGAPAVQDRLEQDRPTPDEPRTDVLLSEEQHTEVLAPDEQRTDSLLSDEPRTDVLSMDESQTDVLRFHIVSDETVVHAEDIIGNGE
jgi:hypothetical protein